MGIGFITDISIKQTEKGILMIMILGCNQKKIERGNRYSPGYDPVQKMWDRDRKIARYNSDRKRNSIGSIYLPGSKFNTVEGHLTIR